MMRAIPSALIARLSGQMGVRRTASPASGVRDAWTIWRLRIGKPGLAALLLILTSAGIGGLVIIPVRQEMLAMEQRLQLLSRYNAVRLAPAGPADADLSQPGLPPERMFPDQLDRLIQRAADHGLQLNDGQYTVTSVGQGQVVCYEVTLPLRGSYPQMRRFLAALLGNEHGVALLDVQFRREKVSEPALEAVVRLAYYLRPSS
jgi:hypothetical protein